MIKTTCAAVLAAAALLVAAATAAAAQDTARVSLASADSPGWDLAAHIAWFGSNQSDIAPDWNRWYGTGAGGVTVGRYLTPHLKAEVRGTLSGAGQIYTQDPNLPFEPRVHDLRATTLHGGAAYQFFDNRWFHPFVGGGVEIVRERQRIDIPQHFRPTPPTRDQVPQLIPASRGIEDVSYDARPFVGVGFKWFVSDRAFIRTDLTASISGRGVAQTIASAGVGVEF
jgi:opacity protein-like surface antigen